MNQCNIILNEIHRRLSHTVHSQDLLGRPDQRKDLEKLVRECLDATPPPETAHLLKAMLKKLTGMPPSSAAGGLPVFLQLDRELLRLLNPGDHGSGFPHLSQSVRYLKGVGARAAALLARLDIHTAEDLLYHFPYRYEDRRNLRKIAELAGGGFVTVEGVVLRSDLMTTPRKRFKILQVMIEDRTGVILAKWFNQGYLQKVFQPGLRIILSGKVRVDPFSRSLEMENPEYEILKEAGEETLHTNRIVPIYHTTAGLTQRRMRSILFQLLDSRFTELGEFFPDEILRTYHLPKRPESVMQLHFPDGDVSVEKLNAFRSRYHKRMIFEEFLLMEMLLAGRRQSRSEAVRGISFQVNTDTEKSLVRNLAFPLTPAQQRVIREIKRDMGRPVQMNRLLQGDVGCGKTVVAAVAAGITMENGYQVAVMAPTEILAEQIYFHFHGFFDLMGKRSALLTRLIRNQDKEVLRGKILGGEVDVVVGTQALIQGEVRFRRLGLVIIDEQHRFGVIQRAALIQKGRQPDVMVMTATPIPRSLSLTVYGDLDISVIDEMPSGRSPIKTEIIHARQRQKVYRHIDQEVRRGRQAYVVYPLVEETEKSDLAAATEMSEHLAAKIFPQWKIGLLHGRMKPEEKEKTMQAFKKREIQILVSTTVVEVGIDVPNATVMVIEHAERFGLAQLHQLRGRVGRGVHPSFCYLVALGRISDEAKRRLAIMAETTDGFRIAEEDLAIRGPGEYFGKRQSGMPRLILGNILRDTRILEAARDEAFSRMRKDPRLEHPEHRGLALEIKRRYAGRSSLIGVG